MTTIENYVCSVRKPQDFDQFWQGILDQASVIPLNPSMTPDPFRSTDDVEVYEVHYDSLDHVRVAGWYCLPRSRSGKLPAIMQVPGYLMEPPIPKLWARRGYAAFSAAPRGKLQSNAQFNPGYPGLLVHNITDKNTYSYRGFYVDAWRGIDFLLSRDEVDPDRVGVTGNSQGGGLSITSAAMCSQVRAAAAGAPYLCGYMDAAKLTNAYPYQEINDYLRMHPDSRAQVESTLAYFDGISFADRITCPIIINVGLQDSVCPPETGFALFNAVASKNKKLYPYDGHGHDAGGRVGHEAIVEQFFKDQLGA